MSYGTTGGILGARCTVPAACAGIYLPKKSPCQVPIPFVASAEASVLSATNYILKLLLPLKCIILQAMLQRTNVKKQVKFAKAKTTECALLRSCKANNNVRFLHLMSICFPLGRVRPTTSLLRKLVLDHQILKPCI